LTQEITFLKKGDDNKAFNGGCEFYEAKMEREKGYNDGNILKTYRKHA
jgi:hypothetical protein